MMATSDGCLRLTRSTGYALRALARLAASPDGRPLSVAEIATRERLPRNFLAKIIRHLARARLVAARPGAGGGIRLRVPAEDLSVLAILEACEGPSARRACLFYPDRPCGGRACAADCALRDEEERIRDGLRRVTLATVSRALVEAPAGDPAAVVPALTQA